MGTAVDAFIRWLDAHSFAGVTLKGTTLQCYLDVAGAIRGALKEPALYLSMYAVGLTQTSSLAAGWKIAFLPAAGKQSTPCSRHSYQGEASLPPVVMIQPHDGFISFQKT